MEPKRADEKLKTPLNKSNVEGRVMHECKPKYAEREETRDGYREAITQCHEDEDGRFWVDNEVNGSQVNFCPFCGGKAPSQISA
jgi:predicted aspartyl protease